MKYRPKLSLTQKVAIVGGLTSSLVAGGCFLGDIAEEGLNIAAGRQINPRDAEILRAGGRVVGKTVQRHQNTRVKYEDANVDIYRDRGLSQTRIEEERALDDIYNQSKPELSEETQDTIREVLGQSIDTRAIIHTIQREYKRHPFDWERNVGMIARAYESESLTSSDKSKLKGILETMYYCSIRKLNGLLKVYDKPADYKRALMDWKRNIRSIDGDSDGMIGLYEFMINHPDTNPRLRYGIIGAYNLRIKIKSKKLSNENAVDLIRAKINLLEGVKDNISLSKKESNIVYFSGINNLEHLLRSKLAKTDPEFKEKEKKLKNTIKEYKTVKRGTEQAEVILTQPWVIDLAKEIGYFTYLRKVTGKIELNPSVESEKQIAELEKKANIKIKQKPKETPKVIEETLEDIPIEDVLEKPKKSSSAYLLIPPVLVLGFGIGAAYKYRGLFYKKIPPSKKSKKK